MVGRVVRVSEPTNGRSEGHSTAFDWKGAFRSFGQELERVNRRVTDLDDLLATLARDVTAINETLEDAKGQATVSWLMLADPVAAVAVLGDLAVWCEEVYLRYDDAALPACWLWHAGLVEELLTLRQGHADAFHSKSRSAAKALDWHERYRPGVVKRLLETVRDCDLSKHEPPALPRPTPLKLTIERAAVAHAQGLTITPTSDEITEADAYQPDYTPTQQQ